METRLTSCPGCGLELPPGESTAHGYYNASPECWSVYTEVLASEYQHALLFAEIHQLTVDAYAVQHAGGAHPDKSVCVHLVGLHLVLERKFKPIEVPAHLQRLASGIKSWPHFPPPRERAALTVFDVALAQDRQRHAALAREWAQQVWSTWREQHAAVAELAAHAYAAGR